MIQALLCCENLGMSVIGFDIGNESCVIATERHGEIDVLFNYGLKRETPAVVSFGENQRFLGSAGANENPESTISHVKRLIGKQYKDSNVQYDLGLLPFKTSKGPRGGVLIHYLDAASIAGLTPLRLIHDCTAIALGYGVYKTNFPKSGPANVLFVDIGHCDTQVSLVTFEQGKMNILSHSFDEHLGGRDFDDILCNHFAAKFKAEYNIDAYLSPHSFLRLRASCEKLKKVLSVNAQAEFTIKRLVGDTDVKGVLTRKEFEILSLELLERITVPCINVVKESGLSVDKIYAIELSGSGSHIPAISKKLTSIFWKEPRRIPNVSECIARGCAMLSPTHKFRDYKVHDLIPYSLGFLVMEGVNETQQEFMLFPKGSPLPSDRLVRYPGKPPQCIQVIYTNKMDFPNEVGHFMIDLPSDAKKVNNAFRVKLNHHGIFELESMSLLEDDGTTRMSFFAFIFGNNLPLSGNLYVSTTTEELHEAQKREHMLAEQDIKAEQANEQRNTINSFVNNTPTKLLDPAENENRDPNARAQATKHLLTCIADYRSIADSLLPSLKEEVNNECSKAEQWLNDHSPQCHSSPNGIDPILWAQFVKFSVESFERLVST
ncbi:hypothetical protein L1987_80528 [Smallanthus sonchifolius]|uniref:Uncharacterized protein n=1 Tax=Smallanthus sonchifolius TaxID=185202 RepID=A0ACB8YNB9_9ASTR|nr:hypothetical protein L1987_80528 [Smallanthus sonchifolius]